MRNTMLKLLAAASMLAVAAGVSAKAADLPEAAPVYVSPVYSWTGLYVGAHVGYGWGEFGEDAEDLFDDADGVIAGVQAGYNWQFGSFVAGVEADISFADLSDEFDGATLETDWLGTVRGRLGYAFDRFLVYGTAGVAFTSVELDIDGLASDDNTHVGWTVGAGIEGQITSNLSAKLEYLYVKFDEEDYFDGLADIDLDAHILRAGLNYKFNW